MWRRRRSAQRRADEDGVDRGQVGPFLDSFGHVCDRRARMEGLLFSLVALLVSQSCTIGLTPVIDPDNKALPRSRLSHADQNYLRADTVAAANAALILGSLHGRTGHRPGSRVARGPSRCARAPRCSALPCATPAGTSGMTAG